MSEKNEDGVLKSLTAPSPAKVVFLVLLLGGVSYYAWGIYGKYTHGLQQHDKATDRRTAVMDQLRFTENQKNQMNELLSKGKPPTPQEKQALREAEERILTKEQLKDFKSSMKNKAATTLEQASHVLSPQDMTALQTRMVQKHDKKEAKREKRSSGKK